MVLLKTFYSKDAKYRSCIYKRNDGLYMARDEQLISETITDGEVDYGTDYNWDNPSTSGLTDSYDIILSWYNPAEWIEGTYVDSMYLVTLSDGRTGLVFDILEDGKYKIELGDFDDFLQKNSVGYGNTELFSVFEIIGAVDYWDYKEEKL